MDTALPPTFMPGDVAGFAPTIDDDTLYEVVGGERVEHSPMGAEEHLVSGWLHAFVNEFVVPNRLGWSCIETLFELAQGLQRRPDVAFVPYSRWRQSRVPRTAAWRVVPALAVEVVSPSNLANELIEKIHEYFEHGVDLIWIVYPRQMEIYVYTAADQKTIRVLRADDTLDGGEVLPGFSVKVADLFKGLINPEVEEQTT